MISIIVPFKYDSNNRLENLLELLAYVKKYWNFDQLIISEMDESPKIVNLIPKWVDYIFAKETKDIWSRSKRVNLAIPLISNDITMILDTDVIVDNSCISASCDKINNNEIDAVTPFEKAYHIPREIILKEMKIKEINTKEFCENNRASRVFIANGGCFITKTSIFKHIRGMNELFMGWGLEDDELINRYSKLGYRYGRINSIPAIHINHERTASCSLVENNFLNSLIEKNRIYLFNKEQILNYFGISENTGKYSCLKEPMPIDSPNLEKMIKKEKDSYFNAKQESYEI